MNKLDSINRKLNSDKIFLSKVVTSSNCDDQIDIRHSFLSILLVGEYSEIEMDSNWDVITEVVIDVVTIIEGGKIKISLDLSYDNGMIKKEVVIENVDVNNDFLIKKLDNLFFDSINQDINDSLELLVRV